mgnify:FL=1
MMKLKLISGSIIILIALFVYLIITFANGNSANNQHFFTLKQSYLNSSVDPTPPPPFPPPPPKS